MSTFCATRTTLPRWAVTRTAPVASTGRLPTVTVPVTGSGRLPTATVPVTGSGTFVTATFAIPCSCTARLWFASSGLTTATSWVDAQAVAAPLRQATPIERRIVRYIVSASVLSSLTDWVSARRADSEGRFAAHHQGHRAGETR